MSLPMENPANKFGVSLNGDRIVILFPAVSMTPIDAVYMAAWLVALAGPLTGRVFEQVLEEVGAA